MDGAAGVELALDPGAETLLVALGGLKGGFYMPPFEFLKMVADLPASKVFMRDPAQVYYHRGLPETGQDFESVVSYVGNLRDQARARRLVVVGASMGGYAALAIGLLLAADEVHAFSPQAFIDLKVRARVSDYRWPDQIADTFSGPVPWRLRDLRRLYATTLPRPGQRRRFHIHFAAQHDLDALHAAHLRHFRRIQLHPYEHGDHGLVRALRDRGELHSLLERAVTP